MKRSRYPSKTSVNLIYRERSPYYLLKIAVACAVFSVALLAFSRFAVLERLYTVWRLETEAEQVESRVAHLVKTNEDYDEISREYQHYFFQMSEEQRAMSVPSREVMDLIRIELLPWVQVKSFNLSGKTLNIQFIGSGLGEISFLLDRIKQDPLVESLSMSVSNAELEGGGVAVSVTLILRVQEEAES